jgi:hypothetical protein
MYLTRRIVRLCNKPSRRTVLLGSSIEDELVSRDAHVAHRASHVISRAIDNEIPKDRLALPESAVERIGRVKLVQPIEEVLLSIREELSQVRCGAFGGQLALVTKVKAFVAVAVDEERGFGEVALLPFVAWEVADDVSVD